MGKLRGPRVNERNLGSPWRETSKNWEKVMRLPDFGYSDVTRSNVMALLCAEVGNVHRSGCGNHYEPAASTKDEAQGSRPVSHLWERQLPEEVGTQRFFTGAKIRPYRSSVSVEALVVLTLAACRRRVPNVNTSRPVGGST